ncbi:MAG: SDR family oxidoreductase [Oligoflexia bacterium]|nr:SDR family oxidoreductase [Oligoflexia bacterium]
MKKWRGWKNDWALVTGASSGIGMEFARQLAASGMNVVLVARREKNLDTLARELSLRFGAHAVVVSCDLAEPDAAARLHARLIQKNIRVRFLCNNAGVGKWGLFEQTDQQTLQNMIQVNIGAVMAICHEFLPDLRQFPSSAVINVSSQAAFQPVPYMAAYAATKAFIQSFSQALHGEWKNYGITVQTLVPAPTATEFDAKAGAYESAIQKRFPPEDVVRASLAALASEAPVAGNVSTLFQRLFAALMPARVVIRTVGKMFQPKPTEKPAASVSTDRHRAVPTERASRPPLPDAPSTHPSQDQH